MRRWRRITLVIIGYFEALILSGIIFGWPSLLYILQEEGVYSKLCENETNFVQNNLWQVMRDNQSSGTNNAAFPLLDSVTERSLHINISSERQTESTSPISRPKTTDRKNSTPNCIERTSAFSLVYISATITYGITAILIGFSLDYFGLWATRFCGSLLTITGIFCLAFTTKDSSWLLWPGLNLTALGTNQLKVCSYQFTNLWPSKKSTILSAYGSGFAISTTVFTFAQYLYGIGVPYKTLLLVLASITILTIPTTFLMPVMKVKEHKGKKQRKNKSKTLSLRSSSNDLKNEITCDLIPIKSKEADGKMMISLKTENSGFMKESTDDHNIQREIPLTYSLFSLSAVLYVYWHFMSFFIIVFYSVSFNTWMYKATSDPKQVAHYTGIMGMCQLFGPFFIPLTGMFTDWRVKIANKSTDPVERLALTLEAPSYGKVATTIILICVMTCKMFVDKPAIYISMMLMALARPLTHASYVSYLRLRFPSLHFNRLVGIFTTMTSVMMCSQYPFFVWMLSSEFNFLVANWLLMACLVSSLVSPCHLMLKTLSMKYAKNQLEYISASKTAKS